MGSGFPFHFGGQAPAGPAAPGLGLVPADVHHRLRERHAHQAAVALLQHALAHLVDMARHAPAFALQPGPAVVGPPALLVVAAVLDELAVLRPADRLGVDLELGNAHLVRPLLVVEHEAAG